MGARVALSGQCTVLKSRFWISAVRCRVSGLGIRVEGLHGARRAGRARETVGILLDVELMVASYWLLEPDYA